MKRRPASEGIITTSASRNIAGSKNFLTTDFQRFPSRGAKLVASVLNRTGMPLVFTAAIAIQNVAQA
jgi:hypothetical protein